MQGSMIMIHLEDLRLWRHYGELEAPVNVTVLTLRRREKRDETVAVECEGWRLHLRWRSTGKRGITPTWRRVGPWSGLSASTKHENAIMIINYVTRYCEVCIIYYLSLNGEALRVK